MPTGRGAHRTIGLTVLECWAPKPFQIEQGDFTLKGSRAFGSHADMCFNRGGHSMKRTATCLSVCQGRAAACAARAQCG